MISLAPHTPKSHMYPSANFFILLCIPFATPQSTAPTHLPLLNKRAAASLTLPAMYRNSELWKSGWLPFKISQYLPLENQSQTYQCPIPPHVMSQLLILHLCLFTPSQCVSLQLARPLHGLFSLLLEPSLPHPCRHLSFSPLFRGPCLSSLPWSHVRRAGGCWHHLE